MAEITWITREGFTPAPKQLHFTDALSQISPRFAWLTLPALCKETTEWLVEHLPKGTRSVFLWDTDPKWVKEVTAILHNLPSATEQTLSVFYVCEAIDPKFSDSFLTTGVDNILYLGDTPDETLTRIKLTENQVRERAELLKQLKITATETAKQETVMKQREEFLSVCAHDLRSPLGLIQSSLSMILSGGKTTLNEFQEELLSRSKRQAGQAITLVNDLLDVMSYEQGLKPQYEVLNLHSFLNEFHKDYSNLAGQKGIKVHYENPIKEWKVLADADRIRQLLQNLFVNAVKFTEKNKNIYLSVSAFQGRRKNDPPYPMIIVSLRDEGRGIPKNELQKVFDRFSQVKEQNRADGRGLGLTVAKQISTLHDGNIWVESVQGEGSTFFVLFPHVISRLIPKAQDKAKSKLPTILVVEPNSEAREENFGVLGRWGMEPLFATDGVQALTLAFHHLPDFILLQPDLQKMDENQVTNILKLEALTSHIPILLGVEDNPLRNTAGYDELAYDGIVKLPLKEEPFKAVLKEASLGKSVAKKAA